MRQEVLTSSSRVQCGIHTFSTASNFHPQFENSGTCCCAMAASFQKKQAWSMDRFRCSKSASLVGGNDSKHLSPLVNNCSLASFTEVAWHLLLYWMTMKRSRTSICLDSSWNACGLARRSNKTCVSSGICCQASHAVFLPHPRNDDVVSHHVSAWKSGRAKDRLGTCYMRSNQKNVAFSSEANFEGRVGWKKSEGNTGWNKSHVMPGKFVINVSEIVNWIYCHIHQM